MEIGPLSNDNNVQPSPDRKSKPCQVSPSVREVTDRLEISQDARVRLAEMADLKLQLRTTEPETIRPGADPAQDSGDGRIAQIRRKLKSGFYDLPEVKGKIVDRLIDDLDI
jgi:hypothetical protein